MELIEIFGRLISLGVEGCIKLESCRLRFKRKIEVLINENKICFEVAGGLC